MLISQREAWLLLALKEMSEQIFADSQGMESLFPGNCNCKRSQSYLHMSWADGVMDVLEAVVSPAVELLACNHQHPLFSAFYNYLWVTKQPITHCFMNQVPVNVYWCSNVVAFKFFYSFIFCRRYSWNTQNPKIWVSNILLNVLSFVMWVTLYCNSYCRYWPFNLPNA